MRIERVDLGGFRNLQGSIALSAPLAAIVGENNAGKSNLVDALRIVLSPAHGPHEALYPQRDDFTHDGLGRRTVDEFTIDVHLGDLSVEQQGRLVTCLTPGAGVGTARIGVHCRPDTSGRITRTWRGGDLGNPDIEAWARTAITFNYLHPLRDAEADLRPGRSNRVAGLLQLLAPESSPDRQVIEEIMAAANARLGTVPSVVRADASIGKRLRDILGPVYEKQTRIAFADPEFMRVVATLRALIGETSPREMSEGGLGYNNLLYIATLLASLSPTTDSELNVILVEEPEAHLHPQLQDLLMAFLHGAANERVQVIMTTHSPTLTSTAGVRRMTRLSKTAPGALIEATHLGLLGWTDGELAHLERFLDVTKAQLLFARSVILVEGIAEQLMMPTLARSVDLDLHHYGVAIVNVSGLAFAPFARLFQAGGLPHRCAILTDSDPSHRGDAPDDESAAARAIGTLRGGNLEVFLARRTFEWDLIAAGNWEPCVQALGAIHPIVAQSLRDEDPGNDEQRASLFLQKIENRKGRYAQALAHHLDRAGIELAVPSYLAEGLEWAMPSLSGEAAAR